MTSPLDTTTVAKVSNYLNPGTTFSAAEQQNIQDTITAWGLELLKLCGRGDQSNDVPTQSPFNQSVSYSEAYDGNGANRMFLRNWPITGVTSLQINTNAIPASTSITQSGYVIDASGKSLSLRGGSGTGTNFTTFYPSGCGGGYWFNKGIQNVLVTYAAGFKPLLVVNELDTIPASAPYSILVLAPVWLSDDGVKFFSSGTPLTQVFVAPLVNQYYLVGVGVYLFNAANAGQQVQISYAAAGTPADLQLMSTRVVALTYKQRNAVGQKSQSMAQGAGTINYDWSIDQKDWQVITTYKRLARV
jgi:hypothetical protein